MFSGQRDGAGLPDVADCCGQPDMARDNICNHPEDILCCKDKQPVPV